MSFKFKINKKSEKKIERKILGHVEKEKLPKWNDISGKNISEVDPGNKQDQVVIPHIDKTIRYGPDEPPPPLETAEGKKRKLEKNLPNDAKVDYDVPGGKQDEATKTKEPEEPIKLAHQVDADKVTLDDFMSGKSHGLYVPKKRKRKDQLGGDSKRRKGLSQILRNNRIGKGSKPKVNFDIDVATRPDETDIDFEQVPIEQFGKGILLGQGWDPKRGIGWNPKVVKPVEAHIRNRNQGLGAELAPYVPRRILKPGEKLPQQKQLEEKKRIQKLEDARRELKKEQSRKKKKKKRRKKPPVTWVRQNCIVRVVTKDMGSHHYCKKGVVLNVISSTDFLVQMKEDGDVLTLCEDQVETVIPKKDQPVIFVSGKRKGKLAILRDKFKKQEKAQVQLEDDLQLLKAKYRNICAVSY